MTATCVINNSLYRLLAEVTLFNNWSGTDRYYSRTDRDMRYYFVVTKFSEDILQRKLHSNRPHGCRCPIKK